MLNTNRLVVLLFFQLIHFAVKSQSVPEQTRTNIPQSNEVVLRDEETGKELFRAGLQNGQCKQCYDRLTAIADSFYVLKKMSMASKSYTSAFFLNNNLGKVKHRLKAACAFTVLNENDKAMDQLEKVVFGAGFVNHHLITQEDCFTPLRAHKSWGKLLEQLNKNVEAAKQQLPIPEQ